MINTWKLVSLIMYLISLNNTYLKSQDTLSYPYEINGFVYDTDGNPLAGVSIISHGHINHQISDFDGAYYANIESPNTAVLFSYHKYTYNVYCPDGRLKVDIVLKRNKGWWFKRKFRFLGNLFRSKESITFPCEW